MAIWGLFMATKARAWANGNEPRKGMAPQKANSRRKKVKHVLGQFYGPFW
jgi:hypothetical protein